MAKFQSSHILATWIGLSWDFTKTRAPHLHHGELTEQQPRPRLPKQLWEPPLAPKSQHWRMVAKTRKGYLSHRIRMYGIYGTIYRQYTPNVSQITIYIPNNNRYEVYNIFWLVVGPPLWKIWKSIGMIIPNIWENKTCSKPPTRSGYIMSMYCCGFRAKQESTIPHWDVCISRDPSH